MNTTTSPGYFSVQQIGPEMAGFFRDNGYLILTSALAVAEVEEMIGEAVAICRGERGAFSDDWADTPARETLQGLDDDEVLRRYLCIHHPHKGSATLRRYLAHPHLVSVLTRVIGPNVKCMQSMLFIKSAGKPGQAWHQDEDYIPTRDRSLTGAWIALNDATIENGCLWVIPGSHRPGLLWPQYPHNDKRFDCAWESYQFPYRDEDAIPVEVARGSIVFFNGYLLHRSLPNRASRGYRRCLVNHYMSAESFLPWQHQPGVAMAQTDYRDIVMVAGEDPHAWRGTTDLARMHVRPDGLGGCGDGRKSLAEYQQSLPHHS